MGLIDLLYLLIISIVLYFNYCRLCNVCFRWYLGLLYAVLSCGLGYCRYSEWIGEFLYVLLGILLLTVCSILLQKRRVMESFILSSLTISVYSVIAGTIMSLTFGIVSITNSETVFKFAGFFQNIVIVALLILAFHMILSAFSNSIRSIRQPAMLVLLVPILFITFVGALISDSIYGNIIIWDTAKGLIFPKINSFQLLALRLLACGGLFSALIAYQKLVASIEYEQTIHLLEQQTQNQEIYVKEAKLRYEQTRSFRHDIKNHLLVLHKLIRDGKANEAGVYLQHMEAVSDGMSFQVQTGNITVDALLSSKLGVAAQKGIHIDCSVLIPEHCFINDMDWCIVLSNALDNAINASDALDRYDRWIHVSGTRKGNVYLLNIENRCRENTKIPFEGIGLSNIRAILKKYNGKMEIEVIDNIFKLNVLFIIPQHSRNITQQTY